MALTPGPWSAREYSDNAGAYYVQAKPLGLAPGRVVACGLAPDNARAIAAVPQMIAALQDLVEYAADCAAAEGSRPTSLMVARAALAVALGDPKD